MNTKDWDWKLDNEHIKIFNKHVMARFSPSDRLCVDVSFSIWYDLGVDWIYLDLTHYLQMDRKTDDG